MNLPARHPLTLRFQSTALEAAFRTEYTRRSMRQVRYALVLGIVVYGPLFALVDWVSAPAFAPTAWTVRGAVCAVAGVAYVCTFAPSFRQWMQPVLGVVLAVAGAGLLVMLALDPSGQHYFEGPVLLILPGYVVMRLRFVWASAVGAFVVAGYVVVVALFENLTLGTVVGGGIFIASANLIGMFAGYMLEDYARRQFWQARVIDEKRAENARLLDERSRFFVNVSHELRTPLTLILGPLRDILAELGEEGAEWASARSVRPPLRRVERNALRLRRLIDQLLDLAKLEAGALRLQARPGPLVPFLRGVTHAFDDLAEREDLTLQFAAEAPEDLVAFFDPDKLEKVAVNLLSNALKFTPRGGSVRVSVEGPAGERMASQDDPSEGDPSEGDPGAVHLRVRDTGPGVAPEEQPHLFDRFHQADDSALRQGSGTGIGLAFAQELIELHGGTIGVESEPGFGTEFTVTLPLGRAHLRDEEIAPDEPLEESPTEPPNGSSEDTPSEDTPSEDTRLEASEANASEDGAPESEEATAVLVVEDNADVRDYVRDVLEASYAVHEAGDGQAGLSAARELVPDLIVTDVMMPGMDGYAFCRALREDAVLDHIPVVMLTAKNASEHRIEGLEAGADAYLGKPFSRRELAARVENLLAGRRRLRRRFSNQVLVQPSAVDVESADDRFLRRAREAVEEHLGDADFDVDAFAGAVGMSRRQLQRKLKAVAGQTPSAFVRLIRLGRGAQLLAQDYGTVSEIAYEVGFGSPSYFTKCFREAFGTTPSEYEPAEDGETPVPSA